MYAGRLWPRTNQITRPWAIGDGYIGQKKLTIEQSIVRVKSYHASYDDVNERLLYLAPARGATTFLAVLFLTWFLLMEAQKG
jgi:hypothetical protein